MRLIALAVLFTTSCSTGLDEEPLALAPSQGCMTGAVFQIGTGLAPLTILNGGDEGQIRIAGELEEQIRWLSGVVIKACGELASGLGLEKIITAESFQVQSVDGMPAYLGVLRHKEGHWELASSSQHAATSILLSGVPGQSRRAQGSVVWVAGEWSGEIFSIRSFGLKPEASPK